MSPQIDLADSSGIVGILTFLLPGFVGAAVFHSLTSFPKPGVFDRIVPALILTLFSQFFAELFELKPKKAVGQ